MESVKRFGNHFYEGGTGLGTFVAIDNVCAWPNLTLLPDGRIAAVLFNQPNHSLTEGRSNAGRGGTNRSTGTKALCITE